MQSQRSGETGCQPLRYRRPGCRQSRHKARHRQYKSDGFCFLRRQSLRRRCEHPLLNGACIIGKGCGKLNDRLNPSDSRHPVLGRHKNRHLERWPLFGAGCLLPAQPVERQDLIAVIDQLSDNIAANQAASAENKHSHF